VTAPSISGSGLVDIAPPNGVPKKFWWESTLNPNREPADTVALRVGKCAHTLFLEGIDAVQAAFVIDNLPRTGEGSRTAMKAFQEKAEADGKIVIRAESNEQLGWDHPGDGARDRPQSIRWSVPRSRTVAPSRRWSGRTKKPVCGCALGRTGSRTIRRTSRNTRPRGPPASIRSPTRSTNTAITSRPRI
jgi:hypothetical protein